MPDHHDGPATERPRFGFRVEARAPGGSARAGRLVTPHAEVETPVFMPVGTHGSVKALTFEQVSATGSRLILGNTYHLHLRPGHELIRALGGLHRFQGWDGALLTDSAGFQVFSLADLRRVDEDGVSFRSHLDGRPLRFTPELSMEVQLALGADIVMAFDHCVAHGAAPAAVAAAVDRTTQWLARCVAAFGPGGRHHPGDHERVLFGIMQGGTDPGERRRSAEAVAGFDLPGYAIGGLSVGEPSEALHETSALAAALLPDDRPRYLMGVGFPDDIVAAVAGGVDMFDCVLPTRMGRTGTALTRDGRLVVKNAVYARDEAPLDAECGCPVCRRHSRAYIRHLLSAGEILGLTLTSLHNLHFYQDLMAGIRDSLRAGRFDAHARGVVARWQDGERRRRAEAAGPRGGGSP
ncbi:MAG: tRNA guanosine(34) transglycosylase Tgt [Candidatus Krumholzibacteriia bacterium]